MKTSMDNSLGRTVYYPSLEYKLGWRMKLGAVALGTGLGAILVSTVMVVIAYFV